MGFDTVGDIATSTLTVIFFLATAVFPFYATLFLYANKEKLNTPEFRVKFESLYEMMNIKRDYVLWFNFIFCIRRAILAASALLLSDYPLA